MGLIKTIYKYFKLAILTLLLTIIVIFCLNNNYQVTLSLNPLPYEIEIRLFLLIISFFLIGVILGFVMLSKSFIAVKISNFIKSRKVQKLTKETKKDQKDC